MTRTASATASTPNTTMGFTPGAWDRSRVPSMVLARSMRRFGTLRAIRTFRRFESLRMDHGAVEFHDDGIDVVDPVVDFHGPVRPQHEGGLRQPVGAYGGRPNDGGAAHLARRMPGVRVDDMVIAHAIFLEVALVIAGR